MGNTFSRVTNSFNRPAQADNLHAGVGDNTPGTSGKEEKSINQGSNHAIHGAATFVGNALHAAGDVHGYLVGCDNKEFHFHFGAGRTDEKRNRKFEILKAIFKNLKEVLIASAEENCILEDTTFAKYSHRYPGYATLQMVQYQQKHNPVSSYIDSSLNYLQPEEFFEKAKKLICDSPEYIRAHTKEAKLECLSKFANVIGVIGQAGVGKSTLSKVLLNRIVSKERLYNIDYIFYIKLRDCYKKTEMNLFQFLIGEEVYLSLDWMNDEEIRNEVLKLLVESKSVCILLDGLDDFGIAHPESVKFGVNVFGNELPQNFILGLLSGHILPGAKKIFTSRPLQMLDLPDQFRPKFLVQILGITSEGINKICKNLCDDKSSQVLAHVKSQPDLYSYIAIPIHCVLVINCIYEILTNSIADALPNSITDVFVLSYILFTETEHVREDLNQFDITKISDLQKICSLAWSGIKKRQFAYGDDELKEFGLKQENISSFTVTVKLLNQKTRLLILQGATSNCTYFTHLLNQEFFAAIYCLFFMNEETFQKTFSYVPGESEGILSNHYLMVVKFMFGLSNAETFNMFHSVYPDIVEPTKHQNLLRQFVCACMSFSNTFENNNSYGQICSLAYELRNESFAAEIADLFPDLMISSERFLPADVLSFCYVLKYRKKTLRLNMGGEFIGNAIELFIEEMKSLVKQSNHIKFDALSISCPSEFDKIARDELLSMKKNNHIRLLSLNKKIFDIKTSN